MRDIEMDALSALLDGLIDFAGLYPPASLSMDEAVRDYSAYRSGPRSDWLGRFVLPASRLEEFLAARLRLDPAPGPWRLSALLGDMPEADLERVIVFNRAAHASASPPAIVAAIEMKAAAPEEIERFEALAPAGVSAFFEIPIREPGPFLAALTKGNGFAKLRAGGVVPEAIPVSADIARFLSACAAARVPFKATAGLHHPFRSLRPLTYAPDAPQAILHGFINVFLAAAYAAQGMDAVTLTALLNEESPRAFAFGDGQASWRGHALHTERLRAARRDFALAFGSCSFDEPRQDLEAAGWL
jgi:hypothetical protein